MATRYSMRPLSGPRTQKSRGDLRITHFLRRRSGTAYLHLDATGTALTAALGLKSSASITHRKAGRGPHADFLLEIHAIESEGIDTAPLIASAIETQLEARAARGAACPVALAREEQTIDGAEDEAQVEFLTGVPGADVRWRDRLIGYIAHASRLVHALDPARAR